MFREGSSSKIELGFTLETKMLKVARLYKRVEEGFEKNYYVSTENTNTCVANKLCK